MNTTTDLPAWPTQLCVEWGQTFSPGVVLHRLSASTERDERREMHYDVERVLI